MSKEEQYLEISKEIVKYVGGQDNIQATAHCATRLRIVLKDQSLIQMEKLEEVDKVKGVFIAGDQLQIIFGAGLVTEVYEVFAKYTNTQNMSLGDIKSMASQKQNPIQAVIKSLSDVFIDIMPAILAAALLMGITGVLGKWDVVTNNETLYAINKLASIASNGIFAILPMAVCYSATKRYGGQPILGMVVGAIMLDGSLANAYSAASGDVIPEVIKLFGLNIELVGFQGGIIIALMMGFIVAKLDQYFNEKIPDVVKLLFSPLLTVFISTVLLFTIIGPVGRELANVVTGSLIWMVENLGVLGYMVFGGIQQIIVISGLHHILGAIESQLLADTGRNFLNPLMSVALMGQGGAVLGYLALNWKNVKARELCLPSFFSTLFGISEPAIFGVNLRYKFPLIAGCVGGAVAGAYVYITDLAALGFGTTAVPGLAIADPNNNGYFNYIVAHLIALVVAMVVAIVLGKVTSKTTSTKTPAKVTTEDTSKQVINFMTPIKGEVLDISKSSDPTFASKVMGEGFAINVSEGKVVAPCHAIVKFVFPTSHAIGLELDDGTGVLIHCGIDTVNMQGEGFKCNVEANQEVQTGDLLLTFNLELVKSKGYSTQTMVIFTEVPNERQVVMQKDQQYIAVIK